MTFDYAKLKSWPFETVRQQYTWKDAALYALSIGYGADPLDEQELRFVYEGVAGADDDGAGSLLAVPTLAVVLATPGFWPKHPDSGIDWVKVLHGEQNLVLHKPLPASATVVSTTRITKIIDKGADKGAILLQERQLHDETSGELLATLESVTFCRGNGGYSTVEGNGPAGGDEPATPKPKVPERAPDKTCSLTVPSNTALIYRLCADLNPLHADPKVAAAAGFKQPILHGLASFGVAAHAILKTCCELDPNRLGSIGLRFSSPVYPGETLLTDIWETELGIQFQTRVPDREIVALSHGLATIKS